MSLGQLVPSECYIVISPLPVAHAYIVILVSSDTGYARSPTTAATGQDAKSATATPPPPLPLSSFYNEVLNSDSDRPFEVRPLRLRPSPQCKAAETNSQGQSGARAHSIICVMQPFWYSSPTVAVRHGLSGCCCIDSLTDTIWHVKLGQMSFLRAKGSVPGLSL